MIPEVTMAFKKDVVRMKQSISTINKTLSSLIIVVQDLKDRVEMMYPEEELPSHIETRNGRVQI